MMPGGVGDTPDGDGRGESYIQSKNVGSDAAYFESTWLIHVGMYLASDA
jgi:hypothetical protein